MAGVKIKSKRVNKSRPKNTSTKSLKNREATFRTSKVPVRVAYHRYTLKRLPFYCTSYAFIFFLLMFALGMVFTITRVADAGTGSITISGEVKGNPPEIAATIDSKLTDRHFTNSQVLLSGTCMDEKFIEIYTNNRFAGMTICKDNNTFEIMITLSHGKNTVVAKTRDSLGQYGPDSMPLTLFYDVEKNANTNTVNQVEIPSEQLLIILEPLQQTIYLGQTLQFNFVIADDKPEYSIAIDWGDGSPTSLFKYDKAGLHSAKHQFIQAGQNVVRITGIGKHGTASSIQTIVMVVNSSGASTSSGLVKCGQSTNSIYQSLNSISGLEQDNPSFSKLCGTEQVVTKEALDKYIWPTFIVSALMACSFYIGEKILLRRLKHLS